MRIAILNYTDVVPTCVTGPADILSGAARMYPKLTGKTLKTSLDIDVISHEDGVFQRTPFGETDMHKLRKDEVYDLVIIPAMRYTKIESVLEREQALIEWLKQQHRQKAQLASICIGAFLLAATGLLQGKKTTTNWMFAAQFREMYPNVVMEDDKIIVDQGQVSSCGGAFSFTTFMLYLLEKFCGREVAILTSKILMINMHQQPQRTFAIFQFQHDHGDDMVKQAQVYIEQYYPDAISVKGLAAQFNTSLRSFIRRFENATSNTPLEYLQRVRIEAAKQLLENNNEGVEQVAMQCGYEDMSFFRKIFKRHVDMTPKEYQQKYGKSAHAYHTD